MQALLNLDTPEYHHHKLLLDPQGRRLAKRDKDVNIKSLRETGKTPDDVKRCVDGFPMIRLTILIGVLIFCSGAVAAETVHVGTVTEIVRWGYPVFIDPPHEDGNEIRLVRSSSQAPPGRKSFEAWPLSSEAKDLILILPWEKKVALSFGGSERDRYGRWLALACDDGSKRQV